ncbi:MAG: hypothetical protein AAFW89_01235 [Bacteroidota bacterium]
MRNQMVPTSLTRIKFGVICCCVMMVCTTSEIYAQLEPQKPDLPSPRGALLRSFVAPGWGHYYVDRQNWNRGKIHLAADVVMILSYLGINNRANNLDNELITFARANAGFDIAQNPRELQIALESFDSYDEYIQFQLQNRNWSNVRQFENRELYNWEWESTELRDQYREIRDDRDRAENQLPALATLLVMNRLVSGLNSFVKTRNINQNIPEAQLSVINEFGQPGLTARLRFEF